MATHMVTVRRYRPTDAALWDSFVDGARNGMFTFQRDYMDYHRERFEDHSLVFFSDAELVAVLPANAEGDVLHSHAGLTFGSLLFGNRMTLALMQQVVESLVPFLQARGFRSFIFKPVPYAYHNYPAQEDIYVFSAAGARLERREASVVVDLARRLPLSKGKRSGVRAAERAGIRVRQIRDVPGFMHLLETVLMDRHGAVPTHSEPEFTQLCRRFEDRIKLFAAFQGSAMVAGAAVYEYGRVAHTQYLASSAAGRQCGALDMLIGSLLDDVYRDFRYLSFGTSTDPTGQSFNPGLVSQKEMFGGRTIVVDRYILPLLG